MNFSSEIHLEPVELYDEFLNLMEQVDYNNNRIVLSNRNIPNSRRQENLEFISNSYPPTKSPNLSNMVKFTSLNIRPDPTHNTEPTEFDTSNISKLSSNEFVNIQDFETFDNFNVDFNDNLSIISYDESEPSDPNMLFPAHTQNTNDYQLQESTIYQQDDQSVPSNNPVVPGLFPKMDIKDEDQFLPFNKLPLNPSFIVP